MKRNEKRTRNPWQFRNMAEPSNEVPTTCATLTIELHIDYSFYSVKLIFGTVETCNDIRRFQ